MENTTISRLSHRLWPLCCQIILHQLDLLWFLLIKGDASFVFFFSFHYFSIFIHPLFSCSTVCSNFLLIFFLYWWFSISQPFDLMEINFALFHFKTVNKINSSNILWLIQWLINHTSSYKFFFFCAEIENKYAFYYSVNLPSITKLLYIE